MMAGTRDIVRVNLTHVSRDDIIELINQKKWVLSKYEFESEYEEGVGLDVYAIFTFHSVDEPWFIDGVTPYRALSMSYTEKDLQFTLDDPHISLIKVNTIPTKIGSVYVADYTLEALPL